MDLQIEYLQLIPRDFFSIKQFLEDLAKFVDSLKDFIFSDARGLFSPLSIVHLTLSKINSLQIFDNNFRKYMGDVDNNPSKK